MAVSQSTFTTQHEKGREGMIGDSRPRNVESWVAGGAVNFGRAVIRSAEGKVTVGATGSGGAPFPATNVVGISVFSPRVRPSLDDPTTYQQGVEVSVLTQGIVYVKTPSPVVQNAAVTANATTGELSSATAAASQRTIPSAKWMDTVTAADGGIARVKVNLP